MAVQSGATPSPAGSDGVSRGRVRRRRVFYVAGFDPASPRKYHGIFTTESARQSALTGAMAVTRTVQPGKPRTPRRQ